MTLEKKLSAREIIGTIKSMSARPEFYSGCEARRDYLDSKRLETIYQGVKTYHGEDAAKNFVQMVADIPVLSATDFLLTFYKLDSHNWKWDKSLLGNQKGIDIGPDNGAREIIGMATIFSVLATRNSGIDETAYIRGEFLREHGIAEPESDRKNTYGWSVK